MITSFMALSIPRREQFSIFQYIFIGGFLWIIIGLRYRVGGDWNNYQRMFNKMTNMRLSDVLDDGDIAHQYISWTINHWHYDISVVNMVYTLIFLIGLVSFSRRQLYPWISMAVSVPYLITVVAMGYARQGVAIGIFMFAITYLDKGKFYTYISMILLASLFHKTALLLLPLGLFYHDTGKIMRIMMIIPVAYGAWDLLLAKAQANLWHNYVEAQMMSSGAKIRVAMNLIPALLLFKYRDVWKRDFKDYNFWFWIALGSVLSIVLVFFASTAVDRMALYFIPIQLVVLGRLPYLAKNELSPDTTKFIIIFTYAIVLFVWLNFATHSKYWIPYQNILFLD